jgi:hypothetical protein
MLDRIFAGSKKLKRIFKEVFSNFGIKVSDQFSRTFRIPMISGISISEGFSGTIMNFYEFLGLFKDFFRDIQESREFSGF